MKSDTNKKYRYRPVLFFALAYLFTWIFWIPAIFLPQNLGAVLMLIGLLAPGIVSTVFVLASGSKELKTDLKNKIIGFYKVKWGNVALAVVVFALIIVSSILLSTLFGQSLNQFAFTEDFSFPIESSQYPFQPTSSTMEAIKIVKKAPAIPTPVKEKSSVKAN